MNGSYTFVVPRWDALSKASTEEKASV